ncbi:MAG: MATE family efflux transporter, partial [Syntrophorhabdus sp.]
MNLPKIIEKNEIKIFLRDSWSISWPMILIMFFEFLTGLVDIYIAGQIGKEIQAAYGFIIQLYFVFIIVGNALTVGAVSIISRLFTAGNKDEITEAIYSTLSITIIAGVFLGIGGFFLTGNIIVLLNIPQEVKPLAMPLGVIYS